MDEIVYGLIMQELECGDFGICFMVFVQGLFVMYLIWKYVFEE